MNEFSKEGNNFKNVSVYMYIRIFYVRLLKNYKEFANLCYVNGKLLSTVGAQRDINAVVCLKESTSAY